MRECGDLGQDIQLFTQTVGPSPGLAVKVPIGTNQVGIFLFNQIQKFFDGLEFISLNRPPVYRIIFTQHGQKAPDLVRQLLSRLLLQIGHQEDLSNLDVLVGKGYFCG